jgi:TrmH family RNA methyltransferase
MPQLESQIKEIVSRQNPGFKLLKAVISSSRARREHQAAWLEGDRLCAAFLKASCAQAPVLVVQASTPLQQLDQDLLQSCQEVWRLSHPLYKEITQVESPSGWGLLIPRVGGASPMKGGDIVILDRIQDPGNVGSILRSSAAAGVQAVWCLSGTADPWSPKVLRSAMGAHFSVRIQDEMTNEAVLTAAHTAGLPLFATRLGAESESLFMASVSLAQPVAWIFGQEGSGVCAELSQQSRAIQIPQHADVESLNVAAAAAVCLFESRRQKTSAGLNPRPL